MRFIIHRALLCLCLVSYSGFAQEEPEEKPPIPEAKTSVTSHSIKINGKKLSYTATAGTMLMKNAKQEPIALFGYTAYVKEDTSLRKRPVLFAYNGGPGSASLWLHMGILGPKRAVVKDVEFANNGPYGYVVNEFTILDKADIVMIDPVGTGFSRPVGEGKGEDFWGTDQDIRSVSAFIKQYITENNRWQSPKFILGESYGGMRTAGVAQALTNEMISLNGIMLVSPFLQFVNGFDFGQTDLPHVLFLPTFAATGWYHNAIDNKPPTLAEHLKTAEAFAVDEYAPALLKGVRLSADKKKALADKLAALTGLEAQYWLEADLRVNHQVFTKEVLSESAQTVGRIDSRFKGDTLSVHSESMSYDPMTTAIGPPLLAAFMDYYRTELKSEQEVDYKVFGDVFGNWDWGHVQPNVGFKMPFPDTLIDLSYAMIQNPKMKVLFQQGYYDLATPHFTTQYMIDHLKIPPTLRSNISTAYYEAGHMMYVHEPSMAQFKADLATFIDASLPN